MMKTFEILVANIARAMRANAESANEALPKSQRDFHAGRRESYLQNVAMISGTEVKDIRKLVLGESVPARKKPKNVVNPEPSKTVPPVLGHTPTTGRTFYDPFYPR